jgi:hypothetical protein
VRDKRFAPGEIEFPIIGYEGAPLAERRPCTATFIRCGRACQAADERTAYR